MNTPHPKLLDEEPLTIGTAGDKPEISHESMKIESDREVGSLEVDFIEKNDQVSEDSAQIVNPFTLIPVIGTLAHFLPHPDLNNCRLLSKLWQSEMDREVKERKTLDISGEALEPEFLKNLLRKPIRYGKCSLGEAKDCNLDEKPHIFRFLLKLQPTLSRLVLNVYSSESMFHNIMIQIGNNLVEFLLYFMTEMKNDNLTFHKYFPIYDGVCSEPVVFPNMRIFQIGYTQFFGNKEESRLGLSCFTRTFPNLVDFAPAILPEFGCPKLLKKFRLVNLKNLKIGSMCLEFLKPNDLKGLLNLGFKLVKFEVNHFSEGHIDIQLLKTFLESQSETLEDLKLLCESAYCDIMTTATGNPVFNNPSYASRKTNIPLFPMCAFPKLKTLKTDKSYVNNLGYLLSTFPNLESLHLRTPGAVKWSGLCPNNIPKHPALIVLMFYWVSASDLRNFGNPKHFPNFKKLAIHHTEDAIIQKVMEFFPELEYMSFTDDVKEGLKISDEGVTGLGIGTLDTLPTSSDPNFEYPVELNRTKPYIGQCKELEYFFLKVTSGLVGEKSILYGILDAPKIVELELEGFKLSHELLNLMKLRGYDCEKFDSVKMNYVFKNYPNMVTVCRERMKKQNIPFDMFEN